MHPTLYTLHPTPSTLNPTPGVGAADGDGARGGANGSDQGQHHTLPPTPSTPHPTP